MEPSFNLVGYSLALVLPLLTVMAVVALAVVYRSSSRAVAAGDDASRPTLLYVLGGTLLVLLLVQLVGRVLAFAL